jgi:hypothetical protein
MMTEPINYNRPVSGVSLAASYGDAWSKANPDEEITPVLTAMNYWP